MAETRLPNANIDAEFNMVDTTGIIRKEAERRAAEAKAKERASYDMHGNVWEWTSTADGGYRVIRGGSWRFSARNCGSSFRYGYSPSSRYDSLGFRLCASGRAD